ncbi:basic phospholipase A2 Sms-N6-like [Petaurus breviceps papuanus]|uniref:basic phospholipase A2 Sms-N6-like n=1 Tax=Petaurus breviceps papuanus TaxID=3040969 RepID=UPI0036DBA708
MKIIFLLAALIACGLSDVHGHLLQFYNMIEQVTWKNALINYGFYGCYCGWGGKGFPKDATDGCCLVHDCCYSKLMDEGCKPKTQRYSFQYQHGHISCGPGNYCEMEICACDRRAAYCMRENLQSYSVMYRHYPNWLCTRNEPEC